MKYTVNTETKIISIEGQMSSEELKGLCEQYPDYSFSGSAYNYIPYYPTTTPIQPYYNPYFGTISGDNIGSGTITGLYKTTTDLQGIATEGGTDTRQGFAGKTTLNN